MKKEILACVIWTFIGILIVFIPDTIVYNRAREKYSHDNLKKVELRDSIVLYRDSMRYYQQQYDSLFTKATLDAFRIEQTKYYLDICRRKPDQKVFLYGWVKRAVE